MNEIDKHAAEGVNKLLVGNKCDLASRKVVSTGETKELKDSLTIRLLDASAKNVHNVEEVFNMMVSGASSQSLPRDGNCNPSQGGSVCQQRQCRSGGAQSSGGTLCSHRSCSSTDEQAIYMRKQP